MGTLRGTLTLCSLTFTLNVHYENLNRNEMKTDGRTDGQTDIQDDRIIKHSCGILNDETDA